MHRLFLAFGAVLAVVGGIVAGTRPADALLYWCWGDPVIGITAPGQPEQFINITVGMPEEGKETLTAPVLIEVHLPSNVEARVVSIDGVFPETVQFIHDLRPWKGEGRELKIRIQVMVHASDQFPVVVRVETEGRGGGGTVQEIEGSSNEPLSTRITLSGKANGGDD